jgi:hypothetical protein
MTPQSWLSQIPRNGESYVFETVSRSAANPAKVIAFPGQTRRSLVGQIYRFSLVKFIADPVRCPMTTPETDVG